MLSIKIVLRFPTFFELYVQADGFHIAVLGGIEMTVRALVSSGTEHQANGYAREMRDRVDVFPRGGPLASLPGGNRGLRNNEVISDLLQAEAVLLSPSSQVIAEYHPGAR